MTRTARNSTSAAHASRRIPLRVLAILAVAAALASVGCFVDTKPLDLDVYMTAGRAVWHGYDLYSPTVHVRQYGFTYPPFAALLFALPAMLPFPLTLVLTALVSLACLWVVIALSVPEFVRRLSEPQPRAAVLVVVAMMLCEPVRATLWDGQINLVLAAMIMWDLLAKRSPESARWRGALVGVAAAIKLTPGIFIIYLLVRRRFRDAGVALGAFFVATALAWLVLPHDSTQFWLHKLYTGSGIGDEARASNILGGFLRVMGHAPATALWAVCIVPTLIIGLRMAGRASASGREAFALGITGVTGCLISPVSWTHHWVWCIPWLAGVGAVAWRRGRAGRAWLGGLVFVYLCLNLVPTSVTDKSSVAHFLSSNALTVTALLTAAVADPRRWAHLRRRVRAEPEDREPAAVLHPTR